MQNVGGGFGRRCPSWSTMTRQQRRIIIRNHLTERTSRRFNGGLVSRSLGSATRPRGERMLASDVDQYQVVDTDTHVIEPHDLWISRLPEARWGDRVPRVIHDEAWLRTPAISGTIGSAGGWCGPSRLRQVCPRSPARLGRGGALDVGLQGHSGPHGRVRNLARGVVPNGHGFGVRKVFAIGEPDLMLGYVQACLDFLAAYASIDCSRYIPIMALPMRDPEL